MVVLYELVEALADATLRSRYVLRQSSLTWKSFKGLSIKVLNQPDGNSDSNARELVVGSHLHQPSELGSSELIAACGAGSVIPHCLPPRTPRS
jgi:hypothetical protein